MAFEVYAHFDVFVVNNEDTFRRVLIYSTNGNNEDFIVPSEIKFETNKAPSFEFNLLPNNSEYDSFKRYSTYIEVDDTTDDPSNPEIIFYGRINSISLNFDKSKNITCEGILANLSDTISFAIATTDINNWSDTFKTLNGVSDSNEPPVSVFRDLLHCYAYAIKRFNCYGADISYLNSSSQHYGVSVTDAITTDEDLWADTEGIFGGNAYDYLISNLVNVYGGILRMSYTRRNDGRISSMLYWDCDPTDPAYSGQKNNQIFEIGENILDLSSEYLEDEPVTGISARFTFTYDGKEVETFIAEQESEHGYTVPTIFGNSSGCVRMVTLPGKISGKKTGTTAQKKAAALKNARKKAQDYAKWHCVSDPNKVRKKYTIKALDMHYFGDSSKNKYKLMDWVDLKSPEHDVDSTLLGSTDKFYILSMDINISDMTQNSYTIGDYVPDPTSNSKLLSKRLTQGRRG